MFQQQLHKVSVTSADSLNDGRRHLGKRWAGRSIHIHALAKERSRLCPVPASDGIQEPLHVKIKHVQLGM